jgi:hypothetical protein
LEKCRSWQDRVMRFEDLGRCIIVHPTRADSQGRYGLQGSGAIDGAAGYHGCDFHLGLHVKIVKMSLVREHQAKLKPS